MIDFTSMAISMIERGWVPDAATRWGIRKLCRKRLTQAEAENRSFSMSLREGAIAQVPDLANEQHYEVPAEFFKSVLGPQLKYSCGFWDSPETDLTNSEEKALALTCEHAEIKNGDRILELGCGWGSLTMWIAQHYPKCKITAISNSNSQRQYINQRCLELNLQNVNVITADINTFEPEFQQFDRVVSVEMFEHMQNYYELLQRIAQWLAPEGKLFVHIFCHQNLCYPFSTEGSENWMGKYFFSGGIMPSRGLLGQFDSHLEIEQQHVWNGSHYERTANAWLANMDANRRRLHEVLEGVYGKHEAAKWFQRWRVFFMACAELFGMKQGEEWFVSHYLMKRVVD